MAIPILMTLFCQLMVVSSQKIYSLEENLICEIKPCDKEILQYVYGQETFGDLTGIPFALSFFFNPGGQTISFVASIQEGGTSIVNLVQSPNYSFTIQNTGTKTSQQFNLNVWYQIVITEQIIQVCNHLACFSTTHNKTITQSSKFNILNSLSTLYNYISACCIIMYKGITYPNTNQITFYNTKYSEVVVNLNIQEKIQSNITVDYSDYQHIAKLGDIFDYDQYDPYLVDDSLLFNVSQYIQINQITINNQYSFEFRFKQSATFTSNIILLNYAFPQTSSQIYIFLNGSKITYKLNNQQTQFQLQTSDYTHFCIGITQFLEQSANLQKLYFIQFSDTQTLQILIQNITGFFIVNPAYGYMYIGSKQNQFQSGEYFNLFIFRYYQGFFYDDQHVMDSNCKIYLNDRCIICNSGYLLQNDHSCVLLSCDKTNYDTVFVPSHNQCIRRCHQKCSTCSLADPKICLTCNSIRSSPPGCMCPNYYFEDQVSPKCRKYYPDITVQTGNFFFQCPELSWSNSLQDFNHIQPTLTVYYQQSYKTTPNVLVSLIGQSINATKSYFYSYYSVQSITQQYFTVKFYCQLHFSYFIFNWISTIGTNIPYPPYSSYTQTSSNNFVLTQSNITYNGSNLSPIYQISVWQFQYTSAIYQLKQQALSSTQIKIYSDYLYFYNSQYWNYFYVLYKTYNISSPSLDTQLDDQPKSIQYFLVQRGFTLNSIDRYRYLNNTRTSTYFKLKQQYNESMEIYDWVLILASQQCRNAGPCDFYDSYISNCNLQFEFCSNKTENYYIDSTFNYQLCDSNCKSCFGTSTNCTSCQTDYVTQSKDINLNTQFCCVKTCQTCSTTNIAICLSCGQYATLTSNQCICNSGYYFDNVDTNLCQQCSKTCQTCKNDDKDYCLLCKTVAILTGTTCICPIGMYSDGNGVCQQCATICKTCIDNLSCTSCIDTLQVLYQGWCYCPDKYYIDNTFKCSHCQFPCENCSDQNTCLTCPSGLTLYNQTCICASNQYLDQNGTCQNCYQLCNTCNGPLDNQCLSCNNMRQLAQDNTCQCLNGYYSLNFNCLQCSKKCQTCANNQDYCLSCNSTTILTGTTCLCPIGQYYDQNSDCQQCSTICKTCMTIQSCTSCIDTLQILDQGQCYCPNNYYIDNTFKCSHCQFPCVNCSDQNTCLTCPSDKTLYNYTCICATNQYLDQNGICSNCHPSCITCYGQLDNQCLSCNSMRALAQDNTCQCLKGYFSQNYECLKCSKKCDTCNNDQDYCLTCNQFTVLTGSTCLCPTGKYYDQNTECQLCSPICKTCMNNTACTTCIDALQVLQQGLCYCPNNYYIDYTFKCSQCQFPCENCLDQNTCLSCPSDKIILNYKCICDSSKYLDQNGYCQDCNKQCNTCSGPQDNQCLSCNSVRTLSQQNQCQCNKGYYSVDNECSKCSYYCQECDQETKCLTCPRNRYLNEFNTCDCLVGFYNKENQQSCELCPSNCAECINYNSCTRCNLHMTLQYGKCKCSDGYYDQSGSCMSCDSQQGKYQVICNYKNCNDNIWTPSEECDDGNKIDNDGCTNCKIDKNYQCFNIQGQPSNCYQCDSQCSECQQLQDQIVCIQCKVGYYLYNNKCLQCDANCKTCSSFSKCETCPIINTKPNQNNSCPRCDNGTYLQNDKCVQQCGDSINKDDEQCDDGNTKSFDGCNSSCQIEDSYVCTIQQELSNCFYQEKPQLKLNKIIKITDQQYVIQILSNQEVKYEGITVQVQYCRILSLDPTN